MANSHYQYASRPSMFPLYTQTPNSYKSQALDTFSETSDVKRRVSGSDISENQEDGSGLSSTELNGLAFKRKDRKPKLLFKAYHGLEKDEIQLSQNGLEPLRRNNTAEPYNKTSTSSNSRLPDCRNFIFKNVKEPTMQTGKGGTTQLGKSLEFTGAESDYECECNISQRDESSSPDLITSPTNYKRNSRRHSAHERDSIETHATQNKAKATFSDYQTNQSRKERLLSNDKPLFARSNSSQKLSVRTNFFDDKLYKRRAAYMSDQDKPSISKPVPYSKANKTTGFIKKHLEQKSPTHFGNDMANTIASINSEYEKRDPIESNLRPISRISESSKFISITPEKKIQDSKGSDVKQELFCDINLSLSNLTLSPILNIHPKKSDKIESPVTNFTLLSESGDVRNLKFTDTDLHRTHSTKTTSNLLLTSRIELQTANQDSGNERISDFQEKKNMNGERYKTPSEKLCPTLIDDDYVSEQLNDRQNSMHKKSDIKDEMSKPASIVVTRNYVESDASDSKKKIPQDLAISHQETNSSPKSNKYISSKVEYRSSREVGDRKEYTKVDNKSSFPEIKLVEEKNDSSSSDYKTGKSQGARSVRCLSWSSSPSKSFEGNILRKASFEFSPQLKANINLEERNYTKDIKKETQSEQKKTEFSPAYVTSLSESSLMKRDSIDQTPEPKDSTFAIPTPRVIGAYVETPMPYLNSDRNYDKSSRKCSLSLESHKIRSETINHSRLTSSLAQAPSLSGCPQKEMNTNHSQKVPINTAQRISASEDLKLMKREQNIEDSGIDSYFEEALGNIENVTDVDYLTLKNKNEKSSHVQNEDFKSESAPSEREPYIDNFVIERIRRKLNNTTDSINDTKQGIERLERQFSTLSTDNITVRKPKNDTLVARLLSWFIVRTSLSRPQEPVGFFRNRNWKFTWLGLTISIIFVWYVTELAMCEAFCHPKFSSVNTWQPSDPFFPWAIPTKLDQWTGYSVSNMIEKILDWLDPKRNTREHWPRQAYSGYDWWGGRSGPAPLHVLNPTNRGLGNTDDDDEVSI